MALEAQAVRAADHADAGSTDVGRARHLRRRAIMRARADVAAALGDFERATALLRDGPRSGWDRDLYHYGPTYDLLRAYPGFQALIAPRG